jgi:hypothetical protein
MTLRGTQTVELILTARNACIAFACIISPVEDRNHAG